MGTWQYGKNVNEAGEREGKENHHFGKTDAFAVQRKPEFDLTREELAGGR